MSERITDTPVADDLCVLRDQRGNWLVMLCHNRSRGPTLASFAEFSEAAKYVLEERERIRQRSGADVTLHFADDCPCYAALRDAAGPPVA